MNIPLIISAVTEAGLALAKIIDSLEVEELTPDQQAQTVADINSATSYLQQLAQKAKDKINAK